MNPLKLKEVQKKHTVNEHKTKKALIAFVFGGSFAVVVQLLSEFLDTYMANDAATTLSTMIVIFVSALLTGLGIYDKIAQHVGAGLFIPISGFSNALTSSALECKNEGLVFGIGSNMFKLAGSVLTYGIVSAIVFSAIRYGVTLL